MAEILKEVRSEENRENSSSSNGTLPSTPIDDDLSLSEQKRPDLTNYVLFHGVTYLGSASINAPRSEEELNRNMAILNEQSKMSIEVTLCVPDNANGTVR